LRRRFDVKLATKLFAVSSAIGAAVAHEEPREQRDHLAIPGKNLP